MKENQDPQASLAAAMATLGELQQLAQIHTVAGIADCTSPRGPYVTELYSARNDKLFFKQIRSQGPPFVAVVNGRFAWAVDSETDKVQPLDSRAAAMILGHDFLMLPLTVSDRFTELILAGTTQFADRHCQKIEARDQWGKPCALFFDAETGRLVGLVIANPIGEANETVQIVFTEWKPVDHILLPAAVVITDKSGDFHFSFRQITLNDVDEAIFTVPDEILKG